MTMRADRVGLYVHIPLCVRKCAYCDFCSYPIDSAAEWRDKYITALCSEIESYAERGLAVDTVFFGGGTPSLLTPDEVRRICSSIRASFDISCLTEFTVEVNPGALSADTLEAYLACGANRISIGLQSIHKNELKYLGRIHTYEDFLSTYLTLRAAGIDNISVDLMYGIPLQTRDSFKETLREVIGLSPEHISVYGLILEEGTPFYDKRSELPIPDTDCEADMYRLACDILSEAGYSHYEISNYAQPGRESRHNLKYWRTEEYIGVGVAASSFLDGVRFGNPTDISDYLAGGPRAYTDDVSDITSTQEEFVVLRLRLAEGFSLEEYRRRFSEDFAERFHDTVRMLTDAGYARISDGRFALTERGFYVSNSIICELT